MNGLVPVRVRDCACPDLPHAEEGDIVYLAPKVSLELGVAATAALSRSHDVDDVTAAWLVLFVKHGAKGANFIDPFDVQVLLDDYELSSPVAEAANDLYGETILRPLAPTRRTPGSPRGQTGTSTLPPKASRRRRAA